MLVCVVYFVCCGLRLFGDCFSCGCFNSVVVLDDVILFGVRGLLCGLVV